MRVEFGDFLFDVEQEENGFNCKVMVGPMEIKSLSNHGDTEEEALVKSAFYLGMENSKSGESKC